ncbi:MAG: DUF459 domain-containing protein [Acidobacteria bacterium]|nr:DUF459 domain-containing protein [Acidobacteriota bacterium]
MARPVRSGASPRPPADDRWFSWRTLLHRNRSQRPGTMSAGMILIVMVAGLLLAMTLNADATLRKSNAKGDGWRNGVASVIATVSDTFQFTFLRTRVDAALGKNQGSRIDAAELVRRQQEAQAAQDAYAASRPPTIAAPTSSAPLHLWVGGDSITQTLGASLQRVLATTGVFTSTLDYHVSTGLARPDYFNWPEHLVRDVLPKDQPSVLVMMFGANDGQNMTDRQGRGLTRGSPEWLAEYRRRVAATMDLLKSPTDDRLTIWCGPPPMGPGTKVRGMDEIAHIVWSEAQTRPWIQYFDTWPFLSDDELRYVLEAPSADGQRRVLRQADDVHMSVAGADRVAWAILARIGTLIDLSSGRIAPPPGETAPASVAERREVPESMPGSE